MNRQPDSSTLCLWEYINPLPNDNFLDWSKLKVLRRWPNKCKLKTDITFGIGRKHLGKRR